MAALDQLEAALRNADAAGDADAARVFAGEISKMRTAAPQASPMGVGERAADIAKSAGVGVAKGAIGVAGLIDDMSEAGARGLDRATRYVTEKIGAEVPAARPDQTPKFGSQAIQSGIEGVTGEFYKPKTVAGEYAQTAGEFAPGAIGGGGLAARLARVAVPAVASETGGQLTKGTDAEPYARVAGALAGPSLVAGARRAVTPLPISPERQRLVDVLQREGVTSLTAGQRTGNKTLQYAESILGDAPGSGSRASAIQQQGQREFTEAAMRRAGAGPSAAPEVLANNSTRLGREFSDLSARNTLTFDMQFAQDAGRAIRNYERVPPSQQRAMVENYVNDIADHISRGGMPGAYYQEMRSRLSRQANGLRNSDPTLSDALRDLRNALDDAMNRSISPADRDAWQAARREYGAQKVLEKSASRAGEATAEGQIVPANLRNTVSAENRGAYARGQGDFSELARSGAGLMAPLPNSGTGQRVAINTIATMLGGGAGGAFTGGLGAMAGAAAGAATPALAGRALMSRPVQNYLSNQLLGQPENIQALARLLMLNSGSRPLIEANTGPAR